MGATVTSFTGLQNLTNIQQFHADYNSLTSIDFSGMESLTRIDISDNDLPDSGTNSLTSVNLSGCTALESLYIDDSDFSAGFPDLSDCTSLEYIDVDQSKLVGSIDLSNLSSLKGFDFNGNLELTEVIISSTQPLGEDGYEVVINDCALTQTVVDNILVALASGSVEDGYIQIDNDSFNEPVGLNATPGEAGRDSLFILNSRGWSFDIANGNHTMVNVAYSLLENNICASTYTIDQYIVSGSWIEVGNRLYQNQDAWRPAIDGWYRIDGDGSVKFEVSGSKGEIISTAPCGV